MNLDKIGALTPSPFIDGPIETFNLTSNPGGSYNARGKQFINQAASSGYRGFGGGPGSQNNGGNLSVFSGGNLNGGQLGALTTNYVNSNNPATHTQNAGFSMDDGGAANQLGFGVPSSMMGVPYNRGNNFGNHAPNSMQFGFVGGGNAPATQFNQQSSGSQYPGGYDPNKYGNGGGNVNYQNHAQSLQTQTSSMGQAGVNPRGGVAQNGSQHQYDALSQQQYGGGQAYGNYA